MVVFSPLLEVMKDIKEKNERVFMVYKSREDCRPVELRPRQESFCPMAWCFQKAMNKLQE